MTDQHSRSVGQLKSQLKRRLRSVLPASFASPPRMRDFAMPDAESRERKATATGELEKIFYSHTGRLIHKWTPFFEAYEKHLQDRRGTAVRMLEIGVSHGGSLEMWRTYLGNKATIFGIDIDPACATRVDAPNQVRIGSQDDPDFLKRVVAEMGGVDIILDDGSHFGRHQLKSFEVLFPLLSEGGTYLIEDLQTSYWPSHEGGYRRRGTAVELVKDMLDDLHGWYHTRDNGTPAKNEIASIHMYDSIVAIEKRAKSKPQHVQVGKPQP